MASGPGIVELMCAQTTQHICGAVETDLGHKQTRRQREHPGIYLSLPALETMPGFVPRR